MDLTKAGERYILVAMLDTLSPDRYPCTTNFMSDSDAGVPFNLAFILTAISKSRLYSVIILPSLVVLYVIFNIPQASFLVIGFSASNRSITLAIFALVRFSCFFILNFFS